MQLHSSLQRSTCSTHFLMATNPAGMPTACANLAFVLLAVARFTTSQLCYLQAAAWRMVQAAMTESSMQAIASSITYPHEVVRSQMHVRGLGPFDGFGLICKEIWQNEGLIGFYKGWATNMFRTVPAAAITFTSFELFARLLREAGARQRATKESRRQAVVSEVGG